MKKHKNWKTITKESFSLENNQEQEGSLKGYVVDKNGRQGKVIQNFYNAVQEQWVYTVLFNDGSFDTLKAEELKPV